MEEIGVTIFPLEEETVFTFSESVYACESSRVLKKMLSVTLLGLPANVSFKRLRSLTINTIEVRIEFGDLEEWISSTCEFLLELTL